MMYKRSILVFFLICVAVGVGYLIFNEEKVACESYSEHEEITGGYTIMVKLLKSGRESRGVHCPNEIWITEPNGESWLVNSMGDVPYSFMIQDGILTYTAATYQIEGQSWAIVNLSTRAINYQDEHPFIGSQN